MRDLMVRQARVAGITVPEQPLTILREPELRALLQGVDADRTFAGRSDAANLRLFIDTGARRAEVANLRPSVFEYIEVFYNRIRRHSSLGNISPEQFEERYRSSTAVQPV